MANANMSHIWNTQYTQTVVGAGAVIYHKNNIIARILTKLPDSATVFQITNLNTSKLFLTPKLLY